MSVNRGIFSSPKRAWTAVVIYTLILYSTLTLAYKIYVRLFTRLGSSLMGDLMIWMYVPIGLALLIFVLLFLPRRLGSYLAFALICLALAYCLKFLTIPAKRFHFLQYGPLTFLVFDALRFKCRDRYLYVWTMATVALIGLGDEILQGILPNRYFGVIDIAVNSAAGLLTLVFIGFVMGEENYPWGKLSSKTKSIRNPQSAIRDQK